MQDSSFLPVDNLPPIHYNKKMVDKRKAVKETVGLLKRQREPGRVEARRK